MEEQYTRIKHLANLGDAVSVMAAIKKYWEVTKRKVIFCQVINTPAAYYAGAVHPTVDKDGVNVCVNDAGFEMIKPLIESQEYIQSFDKYEGQPIDLNFDVIRGQTFVNMPHGMLAAWVMYAYPDLGTDLSQPWISLNDECPEHIQQQVRSKVILNFTERYRNHIMDYYFLRNYAPNLIFAGTEKEYFLFCNKWQLQIPRLEIKNFLELAYAIKYSRFILANQSLCWNLSEAMKTPRILEVCQYADNCQPFVGKDSYGYFYQIGCEYYFRLLFEQTQNK